MHIHPNARLTPLGRERLLRRHIDHGESLAFLATQVGISVRSSYKWLPRFRSGGGEAIEDGRAAADLIRYTKESSVAC